MNCIYLSKGKCKLAGQLAALPVVPTNPVTCGRCQTQGKPEGPNQAVAQLVVDAVRMQQPQRLPAILNRFGKSLAEPSYMEADFPCGHRSQEPHDEFQCLPCDGGKLHSVYHCSHFNRECTIFATRRQDAQDGKQAECCIACDSRTAAVKNAA